jgi:hypothetical protein
MRGEYHLWEANCQTFVNLLLQRIVEGSAPFVPFGTISHALGSGPTNKTLSGLGDFDKAKPMKLKGSPIRITPDFMLLRAKHNIPLLVFYDPDHPISTQIDLDSANIKVPLTVADVRNIARFEATVRTGRPLLSLEAIRSNMDKQEEDLDEGLEGLLSSPGDDAPVIVSDHNGEERLFHIDKNGVWKASASINRD